MAISSRDYLKAAKQRLTTAAFLRDNGYNPDAMYLAGYAIECSLKALILEVASEDERQLVYEAISRGRSMHNPEILAGVLTDRGRPIPADIRRRFRRFDWTTDLRYESGRRDTGELRGFIKTAGLIVEWVEGQPP